MKNKHYCGLMVVLSVAMIVLLISIVVYIGTHMGPPHWEPRVCRWFEENHIDNDDLKVRIINRKFITKSCQGDSNIRKRKTKTKIWISISKAFQKIKSD